MEKSSRLKSTFSSKSAILVVVMAVFILMFWLINKNYLSPDNIRGIFYACSTSGTIAIGMSCLLISGNIDLSAGATGMLGGIIVAFLIQAGVPWVLALIIGLAFGCVIGLINAFFVNVLNFMPFISTLAFMYVFQGVGNAITNAQNIAVNDKGFWAFGSTNVFGILPVPFLVMCALFLIYGFILANTRFGRRMYMCGGNRMAARLAGINPKRIGTILYMNNSAIAVLAGSMMAARMHMASPSAVLGTELTGITAAVLGGVSFMGGGGGMGGAFIGLLLLNTFTNGLQVIGLDSYWQIVAQGILLIGALMLDFFRERARIRALKASMAVVNAK
jgi:ribose/xylose/arabinose/galactoside ABC-type transport system permease subunit